MKSDSYVGTCVDYILDTEFEDFLEYISSGDCSSLSDEEAKEIQENLLANKKKTDRIIGLMKKVSRNHVYAAAFLAFYEVK